MLATNEVDGAMHILSQPTMKSHGQHALALLRSMAPSDPSLRSRMIARGLQGISVRVQTRLAELLLSAERANTPH